MFQLIFREIYTGMGLAAADQALQRTVDVVLGHDVCVACAVIKLMKNIRLPMQQAEFSRLKSESDVLQYKILHRVRRRCSIRAKNAPSRLVRSAVLSHENSLRSDTHSS